MIPEPASSLAFVLAGLLSLFSSLEMVGMPIFHHSLLPRRANSVESLGFLIHDERSGCDGGERMPFLRLPRNNKTRRKRIIRVGDQRPESFQKSLDWTESRQESIL